MRAVQSSSTAGQGRSGVWGRTEQFAALRYVSRYRGIDAAVGSSLDTSQNHLASVEGEAGWDRVGWQQATCDGASQAEAGPCVTSANPEISTVAREALALLHAVRFYNNRLADTAISFSDWTRYTEKLAWMQDRSETLMEQFLREFRGGVGAGDDRFLEITPHKGAGGRVAC